MRIAEEVRAHISLRFLHKRPWIGRCFRMLEICGSYCRHGIILLARQTLPLLVKLGEEGSSLS